MSVLGLPMCHRGVDEAHGVVFNLDPTVQADFSVSSYPHVSNVGSFYYFIRHRLTLV